MAQPASDVRVRASGVRAEPLGFSWGVDGSLLFEAANAKGQWLNRFWGSESE